MPLNHDHFLLIRTLTPLAVLLASLAYRRRLLAAAAHAEARARRPTAAAEAGARLARKAEGQRALADQLLTYNFILFYLLFPSNSACVLRSRPDPALTPSRAMRPAAPREP